MIGKDNVMDLHYKCTVLDVMNNVTQPNVM